MSNPLGLAYGDSSGEDGDYSDKDQEETIDPAHIEKVSDAILTAAPASLPHGQPLVTSQQSQPLSALVRRRTTFNSTDTSPASTADYKSSCPSPSESRKPRGPRCNFIQSVASEPQTRVGAAESTTEEEPESLLQRLLKPEAVDGEDNYGIPPEPTGDADPAIQACGAPYNCPNSAKIEKWLHLKAAGMRFNDRLEQTHAFRNPSIMSKLIEYLGLDELGSNFPSHIYDPKGFSEDAFFDRIAHRQATDRPPPPPAVQGATNPNLAAAIQKAQQAAIQFVSNVNSSMSSAGASGRPVDAGKRKRSKWDQPTEPQAGRRR
ncbi:HCNGP-like protein-domain-containing protein [Powellomyces hirtus]|nr:HCNGP-like protein-domain-containing protein [Powellomyces hirtus]